MTLYDVWDELNDAEENAGQFDAVDAEEAATMYASEDCDGLSDGRYSHGTHPILVRAPDGTLTRVQVYAEWDPVLTAASSELVEPEPSEAVGYICECCARQVSRDKWDGLYSSCRSRLACTRTPTATVRTTTASSGADRCRSRTPARLARPTLPSSPNTAALPLSSPPRSKSRLRRSRDYGKRQAKRCADQRDTAETEVGRLRDALRPFADQAMGYNTAHYVAAHERHTITATTADLRAARSALEGKP